MPAVGKKSDSEGAKRCAVHDQVEPRFGVEFSADDYSLARQIINGRFEGPIAVTEINAGQLMGNNQVDLSIVIQIPRDDAGSRLI